MLWLPILMGVGTLALDRLTKLIVHKEMRLGQSIPIIKNIFHITFQTNDGAAFSLLSGRILFLIVATLLIIAALVAYIIVKKPKSKIFGIAVSLMISGAVGNLLDRLFLGYVVDFLDMCIINFPVFNVADMCVVIGAALFCIYIFKCTDESL
ncbi:MAG: signal peptidase II [Clostridia bacterium]|nr:signal peptidase II [Clostridia bacterium]